MKKKVILTIGLLMCCLVIGRIVYVNCAYPYAGIRQKEQGDTISYGDGCYSVEESKLYTKEKWLNYIESLDINEESKEKRLMHTGMDSSANINKYDYYVKYNPESDYQVLVLKLDFQNNEIDERELRRSFSVVRSVNVAEEFFDSYYSEKLQEKLINNESENLENKKTVIWVYMISDDIKQLNLQSLEFGNNTLVRLKPENI